MGTECYDRPTPLPAPYSFRGGLLWSFRELAKLSLPIRPTKPIPNNMPEATSPKTSEPCSASTRGLPRLFRSTIAPSSASTKPVNRLLFFMHSPPARIPAPNHCDRKAGIVSPQPARWNVTGEESPTVNSNYRQVCSEICVAKRTLRDASLASLHKPSFLQRIVKRVFLWISELQTAPSLIPRLSARRQAVRGMLYDNARLRNHRLFRNP